MPEENEGTTYSYNVCCECQRTCCQDAKPPLSESRKKIMKEYLARQKIKLDRPFSKEKYSYPSVDEQFFCLFYHKESKRCLVHSIKPETCRAGPITFDINSKGKKVEWFLKKSEICAYAGELYKNKAAFEKHFQVAKEEIIRLISELGADELRALIRIEEPYTFKIGEDELPVDVVRKLGL